MLATLAAAWLAIASDGGAASSVGTGITAASGGGGALFGRRLQAAADECDAQSALERTQKVQGACCPRESDCPEGWPATCGPVCAPMFLDFYEKCHNVILDLAGPQADASLGIMAWDRLRDSCIEGLHEPVNICGVDGGAAGTVQRLTDPRGTLVDGSGDAAYIDNQDCAVLLVAPPGARVVIKFLEFDLDSTVPQFSNPAQGGPLHVAADYVRLYDGADADAPKITWLSGNNVDSSAWASQSNQMLVRFTAGHPNAEFSGMGHGQFVPNTAGGFKAVWTFSGTGADCDLAVLGTPQQPTPPHVLMGECGRRDSTIMRSGDVCGLRCMNSFGLVGSIETSDHGEVSPTYPYFRDMVVCFDGTLEVHQFTCAKVVTHSGSRYSHANICHPQAAKLTDPSGRLADGSEKENYSTNVDCGVLLEAAEGEMVAVRFDEFDVGSIDRVDLYDGDSVNAPRVASLFGDFTCEEDPTDCNIMRHPPLSGAMVGGYGSTGRHMYIHFVTREMPHALAALGSEGWLLSWIFSSAGADCDLSGDWGETATPAFATIGSCGVGSVRTGGTCAFGCGVGLMPSTQADMAVWRTIRSFGPSINADPLCWDGTMMNLGAMTCLQAVTCYTWRLGSSPSAADLRNTACRITPNSAPYPGQFALQEEYQGGRDEGISGDMVWYQLDVQVRSILSDLLYPQCSRNVCTGWQDVCVEHAARAKHLHMAVRHRLGRQHRAGDLPVLQGRRD